jgi:hypothetical protein
MASGRRRELVLLTMGWQWVTVATSDDGTPCSSPRANVRWLQVFSGLQNWGVAAVTTLQTHGVLQLRRESVEDGMRQRWLGF